MNYLEQYYRNMCEQLQYRLNLLEKQNMDPQVTDPADLSPEEQRQQRVSTQVHNYSKRRGYPTSPVDYGSEGPQRNTRQTPGGTQYEVEPLGKETVKNVYTGDKFAISHSTQGVPDQEEIGPADGPSKDYEPVSTGEDAEAEYKRVQASKTKALKEHRNNNMNYLEQYYKNLCEQLQSQIDLLEKRFDISKFKKSKKGDKKDEKKDDKKSGKKADKKANKDYDGDGEVESSKDEYFGSKDKAIKKSIADKKKKKNLKEGREIYGGQFTYGGFPRILNLTEASAVDSFNDSDDQPGDEKVATQADVISLHTSWGGKPVEFDVGNDEGLTKALQHIKGIRTGMDAADSSSNIRPSELAADKHNSQFESKLIQMAKQRKLKVPHQGIGGSYVMDYGTLK
jgi:hypothetical protein